MARRTKEDALLTRDQILDAAERVFQRRGVSRTSLQEIAQEACVTRGAIYWHFQNKADLFDAMIARVTLPLVQAFNRMEPEHSDKPLDQLCQRVHSAFAQTVQNAQLRRVFEIASYKVEYAEDEPVLRDRHLAERALRIADMQRVLVAAQALGQLASNVNAHEAAIGLHALLDGVLSNWLLDPDAFNLEITGMRVLRPYLTGLVVGAAQVG